MSDGMSRGCGGWTVSA